METAKQMGRKNIILFDLDGTLTDPMEGITKAVQHALKKQGIIEENLWNLTKFIGPPLKESFMKFYGMSEEEAKKAVEDYREYFSPIGIFENVVYDGMEEMLAKLKEEGMTLCVATSKPEEFAKRILEHFQLEKYFSFVGGARMDGRTNKAEVIAYVLSEMKAEKKRTVMVGDREHDILGAKKNGIESIGVLYGYGDKEELQNAGANLIARDVAELKDFLCRIKNNCQPNC